MNTIERVSALLEKNGKKQKELMDFLKVNNNVFSDWKAGRNKSYNKYLYQIADYLGTTPEYLRGETDDPSPAEVKGNSGDIDALTEQEKLIVKIFRNASLEDKFRMITAMMTIANKTPGAVPGTSLAAFGGGNSAEPPIDDIVIT